MPSVLAHVGPIPGKAAGKNSGRAQQIMAEYEDRRPWVEGPIYDTRSLFDRNGVESICSYRERLEADHAHH